MPSLNLADINYLAVIVAALATFFLGGLWYTALFGKPWRLAHGISDERMKELQGATPPPVFFGVLLVCYFIIALIVAILVQLTGAATAGQGALLGMVLWLLVAAVGLTGHMASGVKLPGFGIDAAYQLLYLIGSSVLLAVWR